MNILQSVKKIPGGLMVIPLFLGAAFNTFLPGLITLGGSGTFTSHLWKSGAMPILAVFLFCNGAQINVKQAGVPVVKGIIITAVKVGLGAIVGILLNMAFGPAGILGLTPLAVIAAMANSNGGLYAALAGEFGDATDVGAVSILSINDGPFFTMVALGASGIASILSINDGPFFTMVALGASGIASIPFMTLVGCVMPIVVGCVLGNMDEELRNFVAPGATMLIPFFAFPLGAGLNFKQLITAGLPGILLGVAVTVITGFGGYFSMKLMRSKHPQVGGAIGTTAGNAVGTPAAVAAADPSMLPISEIATAQVAAAVIVTAILCPVLVNFLNKFEKKAN